MTKPDLARANKQGGGYYAVPVFRSGSGGLLGNFAAGAAADRRGGLGWAISSAVDQGAEATATTSAPTTKNQWLSMALPGAVAQFPSHGWQGMADFCGFARCRRLIVSFQTARGVGGPKGRRGPRSGQNRRAEGGLPPSAGSAVLYAGRAQQTCAWAKPKALPHRSDRLFLTPGRVAIISPLPMGSGVWVALKYKVRCGKSAAMHQARRLGLDAGIKGDRRGLGLNPMIESEGR